MSDAVSAAEAIRLFTDENSQMYSGWLRPEVVNGELSTAANQSTAASSTGFVIRKRGLPTTWRGRKILTLEGAAQTDFPFPPEPDLADD